jgi:protein-L-isoaspartate(D-aspartate) O-methyltransferase
MADYSQQRMNMVDAQVRTNDVTDPRIHAAMREIPRERFVPLSRRALAYADALVEVAPQRYLLDPRTLSKLLQLVEIRTSDTVLDVGCATGYSSAVLARLAKSVVALEQDADLVRVAVETLASVGAANATVTQGQLAAGFKERAPYDVIFVNGGVQEQPPRLIAQLAEGGRLAAILQRGMQGHAELYVKEHGRVGSRADFDASVPLLVGFKKAVGFVF